MKRLSCTWYWLITSPLRVRTFKSLKIGQKYLKQHSHTNENLRENFKIIIKKLRIRTAMWSSFYLSEILPRIRNAWIVYQLIPTFLVKGFFLLFLLLTFVFIFYRDLETCRKLYQKQKNEPPILRNLPPVSEQHTQYSESLTKVKKKERRIVV